MGKGQHTEKMKTVSFSKTPFPLLQFTHYLPKGKTHMVQNSEPVGSLCAAWTLLLPSQGLSCLVTALNTCV